MAGDWIKMRVDLPDDPSVVAISSKCKMDVYGVIGRLHRLWSWADRHTADGVTRGVDLAWIDRYVGRKGFASAMIDEYWLKYDDGVLTFPNFEVHNGASAKSRMDAVLRQRQSRARRDGVSNGVEDRSPLPRPFARAIYKRDDFTCIYCGTESSSEVEANPKKSLLSVDHIWPVSRTDGRQALEDLGTCCKLCNSEKGDRTPEEWGMPPKFLQDGLSYKDGHISVTTVSQNNVTETLPEKRREDKIQDTPTREYAESQKPKTIEILTAYAKSPHCGLIEAQIQDMWDHYETNGWTVNGEPISNWQAAARKWKNNQGKYDRRKNNTGVGGANGASSERRKLKGDEAREEGIAVPVLNQPLG